jgi:hypothetical protein
MGIFSRGPNRCKVIRDKAQDFVGLTFNKNQLGADILVDSPGFLDETGLRSNLCIDKWIEFSILHKMDKLRWGVGVIGIKEFGAFGGEKLGKDRHQIEKNTDKKSYDCQLVLAVLPPHQLPLRGDLQAAIFYVRIGAF